jgi:hypothetical protein
MNKFFFQLRLFISRLHLIFFAVWVFWEIAGSQNDIDTLSKIISEIFSIEFSYAVWIMIISFIVSYYLWHYLLSSFVDDDEILLEKLELQGNELISAHREQTRKEEKAKSQLLIIFVILIIFSSIIFGS